MAVSVEGMQGKRQHGQLTHIAKYLRLIHTVDSNIWGTYDTYRRKPWPALGNPVERNNHICTGHLPQSEEKEAKRYCMVTHITRNQI